MRRNQAIITFLLIIFIPLSLLYLACGAEFAGFRSVLLALRGQGEWAGVIIRLRLPRLLGCIVCGSGLAVSGLCLQSLLRNDLAEPYTLGISGGAALGYSLGVITLAGNASPVLMALAGALLASFTVFQLGRLNSLAGNSLVLGGIAVNIILGSAVFLLFAFAQPRDINRAVFWMMGDLGLADFAFLGFTGSASALILILLLPLASTLDLHMLGDDASKAAGAGRASAAIIFLAATLLTALSVALCGMISFVGLVVPHILRLAGSSRHSFLLPASAIGGAVFLITADLLARTVIAPAELPAGIICGFSGGLFFLVLLITGRTR